MSALLDALRGKRQLPPGFSPQFVRGGALGMNSSVRKQSEPQARPCSARHIPAVSRKRSVASIPVENRSNPP